MTEATPPDGGCRGHNRQACAGKINDAAITACRATAAPGGGMNPSSSLERHGCIPGTGAACFRRACLPTESKARVFPLPVFPRPRTSRPPRVSGRVSTWIGNGSVMPRAASTLTRGARTPRSVKVLCVVTFRCLSGIGCADGRDGSRAAQYKGGEIACGQNRSPRRVPPRRRAYRTDFRCRI